MPTTVSFWVAISGWVSTLLGGALFIGRLQQKLTSLQELADKCHMDEIMTEDKCKEKFNSRQETSTVILTNIQKSIDCMNISIQQLTDSQHKRQVDFAQMTAQMGFLAEKVALLVK